MYLLDVPLFIAEFTKSHRIQQCLSKFDTFKYYLAVNVNLSEDVQLSFARCDSFFVRKVLARNQCISTNTKLILSEDESDCISVLIRNNLDKVN